MENALIEGWLQSQQKTHLSPSKGAIKLANMANSSQPLLKGDYKVNIENSSEPLLRGDYIAKKDFSVIEDGHKLTQCQHKSKWPRKPQFGVKWRCDQ